MGCASMDVLDLLMFFLESALMGLGLAAGAALWERIMDGPTQGDPVPVFVPDDSDDDDKKPPKKKGKGV